MVDYVNSTIASCVFQFSSLERILYAISQLKLQYALRKDPEPLTEKYRHMLSWEGATERLITASAITQREADERRHKGLDRSDLKAAKFHVDAAKKSQFVGSLLRGKILK